MRIAYLASRYPAVSHTFIQREVLALRRLGVEINTFSVRSSEQTELLSDSDRREFETTIPILPPKLGRLLVAHLRALLTRPYRYVAALFLAQRLSPGGARAALWRVFYFVEAVVLWDECRGRGIHHVHAHFANVASDVALLAAELGGPREDWSWSLTIHGPVEFYDVRQHRLSEKVERALFVVCISDYCRSQLMGMVDEAHWPKLRTIRLGVDVGAFRPAPEGGDGPGASRASTRIVSVGRLTNVKGQGVLLRAVADLVKRGLQVEVTVVGDGLTRPALLELTQRLRIGEHVTFTGAVGQDTIRSHYAAADIFCLPSFAEGVPVVLMEAMAMGLPVVTTRIMGIPELVDDGVSGLLVSPGRVDELAGALAELIADPERRASMGRAGREKVCAEFEIERSAKPVHDVFVQELSNATLPPDIREPNRLARAVGVNET